MNLLFVCRYSPFGSLGSMAGTETLVRNLTLEACGKENKMRLLYCQRESAPDDYADSFKPKYPLVPNFFHISGSERKGTAFFLRALEILREEYSMNPAVTSTRLRHSGQENWDRIGEKYAYYGKAEEVADHPITRISFPTGLVLESGCGNGQIVKYCVSLGCEVVGIDFSRVMIKNCKENTANLKGVSLILADARYLPFRNNCFTTAISLGVIEHFPEHELAINELCRVSCALVIAVPYLYSFFHLFLKIAEKLGLSELGYEDAFSMHYIRESLQNKGFKLTQILKIRDIGKFEASKLKKLAINSSSILNRPFTDLNLFGWHFIYCVGIKNEDFINRINQTYK